MPPDLEARLRRAERSIATSLQACRRYSRIAEMCRAMAISRTREYLRPVYVQVTNPHDRFEGYVVNVQKHFAFIRTDPPLIVDDRFDRAAVVHSVCQTGRHAKRAGDIFVYGADVDFALHARQRVTFCLNEFNRRVKAVEVRLVDDPSAPPRPLPAALLHHSNNNKISTYAC